ENPAAGLSYILNRAAAVALGIDPAALEQETLDIVQAPIDGAGPVIGVVADTHFESIRRAARPLVFMLQPPQLPQKLQMLRNAAIRIRSDNLDAALAHIDATWQRMYPNQVNN